MLQHPKGPPRKVNDRPQRRPKTQHCPQRLSFRRLALVVVGGGGRLPLSHMAIPELAVRRPSGSSLSARSPFQCPLLARRPSLSCPSSSPCRQHSGFLSCRGHPCCLPSSWLRPGLLTGQSWPSLSRPGHSPGFLLGRSLPGSSLRPHPGCLPGPLDCLSLPGSTLPGLAELPLLALAWLPSLPSLSLCFDFSCLVCCCVSVSCSHVLVLSSFCHVPGGVPFLGGGGGVVSGFCHFSLVLFMVL